ncbi:MAG: response regulator transcription factor [Planctomycetota bacterium]
MSGARLLVVEDEPLIGRLVADNLRHEGYEVELVPDGGRGLERAQSGEFDLVLLDLMLPTLPGLELLKRLRAGGATLPVLILSARGHEQDRIQGLKLGADDYLPKPFHLQELLLRIRALLRRTNHDPAPEGQTAAELVIGGVRADFGRCEVSLADGSVEKLSAREAQLLQLLVEHEGKVVERRELMERVWNHDEDPNPRTIDNFIARFRKLFEDDPRQPRHFLTLRGVGYRFER